MRKFASIIIIFVYLSFNTSKAGLCSQPADFNDIKLKQTEFQENIKDILGRNGQDITNLESNVNILKEEIKTLKKTKDKLIENKVEGEVLDLVTKQKSIIENRIDTLDETIRIKMEMKGVAGILEKELKIFPVLTDKKNKASEEAALLPASQFESIQKETELLKIRLEAIQATVKEKEAYLLTSKTSIDALKLKSEEEKKRLIDKLKALTNQKPSTQEDSYQSENRKRRLEHEIKLQDEKITLLLAQTGLARLNLQSAEIQKLNTQLEIDVKSEIVSLLSQKFKESETQRREKEVEEAKKLEGERRRIAEEEKARAELEKNIALRKEEVAVQKQLEETSPEKKRVLAVEADLHKQKGLIATMKDELITTSNESHKDRSEFKRIQRDIEEILGGENTPHEIAEELNVVNTILKNLQDKIQSVKSLLVAVEKQKSIISESLRSASTELISTIPGEKSSIEKEAEGFSDKALGEQLIRLARLRVKHIEEQHSLVETKIERLNERFELNKVLLERLTESQKTISQIRAANVWARRESGISTKTVIVGLSDIRVIWHKPFDLYKASVQNYKQLRVYLSDKKNIPVFVVKLLIIIIVLFLVYFIRRYLKRWARQEITRYTAITPQTFSTYKLIPGLLRIMKGVLTVFFLFIITLTISLVIPSHAPIVRSLIYGLAVVTVYKLLKRFIVQSLSPNLGKKRWVMITYSSAKHSFKGLNAMLLFSAIVITLIFVLEVHSYRESVIELLWFVYRIVMLCLLIWLAVGQKSYLLKILPYPESALGKLVNKTINLLYPLFIAFIILLFSIRSLGYVLLTYTLIATLIKSMFVAIIAYLIYRYILRRQSLSQTKKLQQLKMLETKESEVEEKIIKSRFSAYKHILDYGTVIIAVIIIFVTWNDTFKDVVNSAAAPGLFREIYENVLYVFISIKNSLAYKFVLAEGRYTTPFKILFGILILVAAFISARYLKNVLQTRFENKEALGAGARHAISFGIRYLIIGIAALIGLNVAGIPLRSLSIFAGAFGIGIGFGMQNIINNFVSGLILMAERPIKIGDIVEVDTLYGTIEYIGARSTRVRSSQNTHIIVPNSSFLQNNVLNWTLSDNLIRTSIKVGVVYGSPTREVKRLINKAVDEHEMVLKIPEPVLLFTDFGDNSLQFEVHFWIVVKRMFDRRRIESELRYQIDDLFREVGIVIAFPQRDVHLDSHKPIEVRVVKDGDTDSKTCKDSDSTAG
ncbi:small-conductance mechanosensitive channel [Candidatus Scalindua japonica]|uniref:Small-conductance mechanosensitive channel n=1 Tax=Candidatus Scalindua japonica TaxID=1284222 RepID=A0A286U4T7_9BACT|nr:mechanosensitive ion channel domain-containing protein [Candidatus Scalindua japonica]GAX63051.1 small-conductance mechanosensitive channel [Candidatus Scalindua japonica]